MGGFLFGYDSSVINGATGSTLTLSSVTASNAGNYQATIAVGDRIGTSTAAASGPVAALTAMLHDRGIAVEISAFHQRSADGCTATIALATGQTTTVTVPTSSSPVTMAARSAAIRLPARWR